MIRYIFAMIVLLHGLIHLMGFAKAYRLANIPALTASFSKAEGMLWLFATTLFIIVFISFLSHNDAWWLWGMGAIVLSQVLITKDWHDAKVGTIANVIVSIVVVLGFATWKFNRRVERDVRQMLTANEASNNLIVSIDMLADLPQPVKKWVLKSGIVGKEKIRTVYLTQKGLMRTNPKTDKWVPTTAEQYFTIDRPGFVWKVQMNMMSMVPVVGEDRYVDGRGHMTIKAFSLINIVDDGGDKIDQGTLQRYLAEIGWFPSAALSPYIRWEGVNDTTGKATMQYKGISGSVTFHFNSEGDLVAGTADRYMGGANDATLEKWVVTSKGYAEMSGIRMPVKSEATWKLKTADYTWYKLEITHVEFNSP